MLASITPLGERGRGSRWGLTMSFLLVGSLLGGALIGATLGAVGSLVTSWIGIGSDERLLGIGLLVTAAGIADGARVRVPTTMRQVNPYWVGRYRGWVVGAGFGFQLGLGVGTIVTTAIVYSVLGSAALSGAPVAGAAIGALFGLGRWLGILPTAAIRTPFDLLRVTGAFTRASMPASIGASLAACLAGLVLIAATILGVLRLCKDSASLSPWQTAGAHVCFHQGVTRMRPGGCTYMRPRSLFHLTTSRRSVRL